MPLETVWIIHSFSTCQLNFCLAWQAMCCRNDCDRLPEFRHCFFFVRIVLANTCHCWLVSLSLEIDCDWALSCAPLKCVCHSLIPLSWLIRFSGSSSHCVTAARDTPRRDASLLFDPAISMAFCKFMVFLSAGQPHKAESWSLHSIHWYTRS